VIAAVWPVADASAAAMAAGIYRRLEAGPEPAPAGEDATAEEAAGEVSDGDVAVAVHQAVRQLRARYPPLSWAAYLHIGP
jgi:hypothetical protein